MKSMKNVKISVNMFDDTKLKIIDTKPERDLIHYIWFRMVALAGKVNRDGELYLSKNIPFTPETLAIEFNRGTYQINTALDTLIELEMVEIVDGDVYKVKNFSKHQNGNKNSGNINNIKPDMTNGKYEDSIEAHKSHSNRDNECHNIAENEDVKADESEIIQSDSKEITNSADDKSINPFQNRAINDSRVINSDINKDNKKNKVKLKAKEKKKRKINNKIECIDVDESDYDGELITFHDGEVNIAGGKVVNHWDF